MRSKVLTVRILIRESFEEKVKILNGKMWVPILSHPELLVEGTVIYYDPPASWFDALQHRITILSKHIDQQKASPPTVNVDDENAWDRYLETVSGGGLDSDEHELKQLQGELSCANSFGKIEDVHNSNNYAYIKFNNGVDIGDPVPIDTLWVALDTSAPDYRPDEALPEDYYAL